MLWHHWRLGQAPLIPGRIGMIGPWIPQWVPTKNHGIEENWSCGLEVIWKIHGKW